MNAQTRIWTGEEAFDMTGWYTQIKHVDTSEHLCVSVCRLPHFPHVRGCMHLCVSMSVHTCINSKQSRCLCTQTAQSRCIATKTPPPRPSPLPLLFPLLCVSVWTGVYPENTLKAFRVTFEGAALLKQHHSACVCLRICPDVAVCLTFIDFTKMNTWKRKREPEVVLSALQCYWETVNTNKASSLA